MGDAVRAGVSSGQEELFDKITLSGNNVGKMTGLWGTWNASFSNKTLFYRQGGWGGGDRRGPVEASAERRDMARAGTLSFFLLRHRPGVIFKIVFVCFWLCWVFVAARAFSSCDGGALQLQCVAFPLQCLLLLQCVGTRRVGVSSAVCRL